MDTCALDHASASSSSTDFQLSVIYLLLLADVAFAFYLARRNRLELLRLEQRTDTLSTTCHSLTSTIANLVSAQYSNGVRAGDGAGRRGRGGGAEDPQGPPGDERADAGVVQRATGSQRLCVCVCVGSTGGFLIVARRLAESRT